MTFFRPICHERSWLTGCERHEVATPKRRMVPRANQQRRCRKPFAKCKPNTIWKALSKLLFFISEGWRFFGARVERIHWPIRFDWDAKQLKKALAFGRSRGNCKKNSSFSLWPLNLDIFFLQVRTKDRTFESVSHLINYHRDNGRPIISAESALRLIAPVKPALRRT